MASGAWCRLGAATIATAAAEHGGSLKKYGGGGVRRANVCCALNVCRAKNTGRPAKRRAGMGRMLGCPGSQCCRWTARAGAQLSLDLQAKLHVCLDNSTVFVLVHGRVAACCQALAHGSISTTSSLNHHSPPTLTPPATPAKPPTTSLEKCRTLQDPCCSVCHTHPPHICPHWFECRRSTMCSFLAIAATFLEQPIS